MLFSVTNVIQRWPYELSFWGWSEPVFLKKRFSRGIGVRTPYPLPPSGSAHEVSVWVLVAVHKIVEYIEFYTFRSVSKCCFVLQWWLVDILKLITISIRTFYKHLNTSKANMFTFLHFYICKEKPRWVYFDTQDEAQGSPADLFNLRSESWAW